ncbi:MAG: hypothetical protein M3Z42_01865 [Bifidobacteriales bacterium]|nr:hypothetical protein [Bifidobacteriales bacterium]
MAIRRTGLMLRGTLTSGIKVLMDRRVSAGSSTQSRNAVSDSPVCGGSAVFLR